MTQALASASLTKFSVVWSAPPSRMETSNSVRSALGVIVYVAMPLIWHVPTAIHHGDEIGGKDFIHRSLTHIISAIVRAGRQGRILDVSITGVTCWRLEAIVMPTVALRSERMAAGRSLRRWAMMAAPASNGSKSVNRGRR